jgi:hypothetical protein
MNDSEQAPEPPLAAAQRLRDTSAALAVLAQDMHVLMTSMIDLCEGLMADTGRHEHRREQSQAILDRSAVLAAQLKWLAAQGSAPAAPPAIKAQN